MNCSECGIPATKVGESAVATMYRCPRSHITRALKAKPADPYLVRATPPDTSRDRTSYAAPKPFGPDSLPAKVLAEMRRPPHRLGHHQAERLWNHTRLAGTIHILRTHGYKFETHMNEGKCAVYELLNPQHRHTP